MATELHWSGTILAKNGGPAFGRGGHAGYAPITNVGGAWANLDDENKELATAAHHWSVPPNLAKSVLNAESSGDWERDNRTADVGRLEGPGDPNLLLPFVGIFETTARAWNYAWNRLIGNKALQIDAMAYGLSKLSREYGGFENAATVYFGGPSALDTVFVDEFGRRSDQYAQSVIDNWKYLDAVGEGKTPVEPGPITDGGGSDRGGSVSDLAGQIGAGLARVAVFMLGLLLLGVSIWRLM